MNTYGHKKRPVKNNAICQENDVPVILVKCLVFCTKQEVGMGGGKLFVCR
jgi:hypothetical protein